MEKWPHVGDVLWGPTTYSSLVSRAMCSRGASSVGCVPSSSVAGLATVSVMVGAWTLACGYRDVPLMGLWG